MVSKFFIIKVLFLLLFYQPHDLSLLTKLAALINSSFAFLWLLIRDIPFHQNALPTWANHSDFIYFQEKKKEKGSNLWLYLNCAIKSVVFCLCFCFNMKNSSEKPVTAVEILKDLEEWFSPLHVTILWWYLKKIMPMSRPHATVQKSESLRWP